MKLVEILARELSEWPACGVSCIVQDPDAILYVKYDNDNEPLFVGGEWENVWYEDQVSCLLNLELATDYATAIVTRKMWEAEKYSLFGNCEDTIKEVVVEGCALYDPIKSRDRIYEIDSLVESLEEERAALVQGLEDEGFKLLGKGVKGDGHDQPTEDMNVPSNWKKGDIIEAISECSGYKPGYTYSIKGFDRGNGIVCTEYDSLGNDYNGWYYRHFKFHSRPKV